MAKLLYYTAAGPHDPGRAVFPIHFANAAAKEGHSPTVFLASDAVYLLKQSIARDTKAPGWPSALELFQEAAHYEIPIFV